MKYLLLAIAFTASLALCAQETYEFSVEDVSLEEAIKEISKKYKLKFSYDPQLLRQYRITKSIQTNKEKKLLEELLAEVPIHHKKAGNFILLIPDRVPESEEIIGKVYDSGTGQVLSYAQVATLDNANINDGTGAFSLRAPRDSMQITVTHLGYKPSTFWVKPDVENVNIELTPDIRVLPEFIFSDYSKDKTKGKFSSYFSINPKQVQYLPTVGEPDIFRSMQLLPGISASDDSNAGLVVRGSDPSQNHVILDGFTLYHLNHLFGLYSTFNPYVINQIDLYKSGFTARYGGRISSVVNATGKRGNTDELKAGMGLSLTSFNTYFESPINKKISVIFGLRRSYQNFIKNNIYDRFLKDNRVDLIRSNSLRDGFESDPDFNFFDMNTKVSANLGKNSNLDFNFYFSDDEFESLIDIGGDEFFRLTDIANWSNLGLSLYWDKDWGQVHSTIGTSFSNFESNSTFIESYEIFGDLFQDSILFLPEIDTIRESYEFRQLNNIEEFSINWKNEIELNSNNTLFLGTDLSSYFVEFAYDEGFENELINFADSTQESSQISTYAEFETNFNRFYVNLGLRFNYFEFADRNDLEPRLNAKYYFTDNLSLNFSWSRHHQYITRIADNPFANSDTQTWVMADDQTFPTMESTHWVSGLKFNQDKWSADLEFYHRNTSNIFIPEIFYFTNFEFVIIDEDLIDAFIADELDYTVDGFSRGMDFFLKYKTDRFTSWLSYSLSESKNSSPLVNDGEAFNSSFDQRHEFNQVNLVKLGNWHFSSQFVYGSGRPYTAPKSIELDEFEAILYDLNLINSQRLPSYHRLDLSANYKMNFKKFGLEAGLTLFNVYNRTNIRSRRFVLTSDFDSERLEAIPIDFRLLGFTPNLTLNFSF
jgi:ferric enterobactin receptor